MKRNRIAEAVGLSLPSVSERIRKLEERGVITRYSAVVSPRRLHFDILAFIRVDVDGSQHFKAFVKKAVALPEVQEVHSITGEGSHILKIRTQNTAGLERLLGTIQRWPGVHGTRTSMALSTYKETRDLPIEPMDLHIPDTAS